MGAPVCCWFTCVLLPRRYGLRTIGAKTRYCRSTICHNAIISLHTQEKGYEDCQS